MAQSRGVLFDVRGIAVQTVMLPGTSTANWSRSRHGRRFPGPRGSGRPRGSRSPSARRRTCSRVVGGWTVTNVWSGGRCACATHVECHSGDKRRLLLALISAALLIPYYRIRPLPAQLNHRPLHGCRKPGLLERPGRRPTTIRPPTSPFSPSARFAYSTACLLYTSPSPRDGLLSRMPSSA